MSVCKVSVCVPTYNYAHFLGRAVESVLAQDFTDFELLVFDDASSDNTAEVMQPFLADERVTFVQHEVNQGLFANFNQSMEAAKGEYLKYLCADDWLAPDFLSRTVELLDATPQASMVTTANWLVDADDQPIGEEIAPFPPGPVVTSDAAIDAMATGYNVIGMPTNTLIRRAELQAVGGFDAQFAPAADVDLWFKLLSRGELGWIPENLCFVRIHDVHTHQYGSDPHEAIFRVWEHGPSIERSAVSAEHVKRAQGAEASRFVAIAVKHAAGGRFGRARKLLATARRHVGLVRSFGLFLKAFPALVRDRRVTARAAREGRILSYDPRPEVGPELAEVKRRLGQ